MADRGYWEDPGLTAKQRLDNWWRYHWLSVMCAVLAVIALCGVLWERTHRVEYDCSVALVTRYAATPDEITSLQRALEGFASDCNGDGTVRVAVNAIQIDYTSTDLDDAAIQLMTANVDKLSSDFYTCQSGIFLLDDPENFQRSHGALAYLDGSLPPEGAADWENMTIPWSQWTGGEGVELDHCNGETLWFGQRISTGPKDEKALAGARALWNELF